MNFIYLCLTLLSVHADNAVQSEFTSDRLCGRDSVYLLLKLRGANPDFTDVTSVLRPQPGKPGISMDELRQGAGELGLTLAGYKLRREDVRRMKSPFIGYIEEKEIAHEAGHYFVLSYLGGDRVQILNPPKPVHFISVGELFEDWEGHALVPVREYKRWQSASALAAIVVILGAVALLGWRRLVQARN
jgi:ABC-type bacteriocin/lantibiotic exporter with double-glycine peptidase domain